MRIHIARTLANPININNHPHQLNLFLFGPLKMISNWLPFAIHLLNCNTICGIRVPAEERQNNKTLGFKSKIQESVLEQKTRLQVSGKINMCIQILNISYQTYGGKSL